MLKLAITEIPNAAISNRACQVRQKLGADCTTIVCAGAEPPLFADVDDVKTFESLMSYFQAEA